MKLRATYLGKSGYFSLVHGNIYEIEVDFSQRNGIIMVSWHNTATGAIEFCPYGTLEALHNEWDI